MQISLGKVDNKNKKYERPHVFFDFLAPFGVPGKPIVLKCSQTTESQLSSSVDAPSPSVAALVVEPSLLLDVALPEVGPTQGASASACAYTDVGLKQLDGESRVDPAFVRHQSDGSQTEFGSLRVVLQYQRRAFLAVTQGRGRSPDAIVPDLAVFPSLRSTLWLLVPLGDAQGPAMRFGL